MFIMTWNTFVAACMATIVALYAGIELYDDNVFSTYESEHCRSSFYSNVGHVRAAAQGMWIGGLFVLFFGVLLHVHHLWTHDIIVDSILLIATVSIVVSGLLGFLVSLTGTCEFPVNETRNNEVKDFNILVGFIVALGLVQALVADVRYDSKTNRFVMMQTTGILFGVIVVVRMILVATIVAIQHVSPTTFESSYVAQDALATTACQGAVGTIDWQSPAHTFYNQFSLGTPHLVDQEFEYNQKMVVVGIVMLVATIIEIIARIVHEFHPAPFYKVRPIWIARLMQRFADACIVSFVYSFVGANNIAACPTFNANHSVIQLIYTSMILHYGLSTLHIFACNTNNSVLGRVTNDSPTEKEYDMLTGT